MIKQKNNHRYLFVVTYGRSCSTLLIGILNSIKGYHITGENNDAYKHLMSFYKEMLIAKNNYYNCIDNFNLLESTNPWYNTFDITDVKEALKNLTVNILDPHDEYDVVGFKEIRYNGHIKTNDLSEYLNFLHTVYDPFFIFLTRDLNKVSISKWHARNPEKCKKNLTLFEEQIRNHINVNKCEKWYHIDASDMINKSEVFYNLFGFLNVKLDDMLMNRIDEVLKVKHSY